MTEPVMDIWMVSASGDGSRDAVLVRGDREAAKDVLIELMFFGPKEEALKDEMIAAILKDFDDVENCWRGEHGHQFYFDLEQGYIDVQRIDRIQTTAVEFETSWGWTICHDGERIMFPRFGGEGLMSQLKNGQWKVTCAPIPAVKP